MQSFDEISDRKISVDEVNEDINLVVVKATPNQYLGINIKADVRPMNLLVLPYLSFFAASLVGFLNTQMIFMLRDPASYNVPEP